MAAFLKIVPAAARDLLYRLTESLEIPFTLTDREGVVIASTAGRPAGQVDPYAIAVMQRGTIVEISEDALRPPAQIAVSPAAEHAGLLPPAPGVYAPVRMNGVIAAILFARGEPDDVRNKAISAAAGAGPALEFTSGAHSQLRQTLGPDLALRTLLRGTQNEARRAALMAKVAGWDLLTPRAALVITPATDDQRLPEAGLLLLAELLRSLSPNAPVGKISATEWVTLPGLPRSEIQPSIMEMAGEMHKSLSDQGLRVLIGVGETHIDLPILPGLRRSYREAGFCADWARKLGMEGGVHTLRSLGPLAFLAPGIRAREQFARRLLDPLQRYPDILKTVSAFLDANLSLETAAKKSGQHRHTVRSHLQRAHDLTGLDPRDLADALQFKLALLLGQSIPIV